MTVIAGLPYLKWMSISQGVEPARMSKDVPSTFGNSESHDRFYLFANGGQHADRFVEPNLPSIISRQLLIRSGQSALSFSSNYFFLIEKHVLCVER